MSRIPTDLQWADLAGRIKAAANVQANWSQADSTKDDFIKNKPSIPSVNDATLTIKQNSATLGSFTANASTNKTITVTVPTTAADVSALPDSTKYAASMTLTMNSSTYVVTAQLKDQDGNSLGTAQTIDLPLETVVVGGTYDATNKKIVLSLKNGTTIDIPVADLVSGLQTEITSTNKLSADLVNDATSSNKFVTASDKTTWNNKQNKLTAGTNISISGNTISATDTTYSDFTGTDGTSAGTNGLVPAPATSDAGKFLRADGSWATATYSLPIATTSELGGVIIGDGINVASDGTISVNTFSTQEWNALWA